MQTTPESASDAGPQQNQTPPSQNHSLQTSPQPQQQQQQQWLMMSPSLQPGMMISPQVLMAPQGFSNMQQQQQQPQSPFQGGPDIKTLWVGDLQFWMDENYLYSCFAHAAEVQTVKIIRNKLTGYSEGYGFVEFSSHSIAEKILQSFNGTQMPSTDLPFRLNWASFGIGERRPDQGPDFSIFVGDLAPDVTDYTLQETFQSRYTSVKGAKVVMDTTTGRSKGYGFVRFGDESEKNRAMTEMNGIYCSSRAMRISSATPKKSLGATQLPGIKAAPYQVTSYVTPQLTTDNDPNNTTVFVGGLDQNIKDEDLKQVFSKFGSIQYVKIPVGKGCGFVQFFTRASAEEALQKLHGSTIGQQTIRLSWGRSPANKQQQQQQQQRISPAWGGAQFPADASHWNGVYYGYGAGAYDGYGYMQTQDPAAAAAAAAYAYGGSYHGYGTYPQQVN